MLWALLGLYTPPAGEEPHGLLRTDVGHHLYDLLAHLSGE